MPKKAEMKIVLYSTIGVILAGWVMHQFRDVGIVADAHRGFS